MPFIPDHPVVSNLMRTGLPDNQETRWPRCPICGAETDTFYRNRDREVVGCEDCLCTVDAWDYEEEWDGI